jgi:NAD(P)-dependent dehydrogenase (short-subunit alcohol dehydrogenase family)
MDLTLQGKRALVTGGSRGIGAAIVKRLAREGADVAFTYVSKADEANGTVAAAREFGVRAVAFHADSADAQAVVAAVERTASELGGLDILVNNAGILAMESIDQLSLAEFDRTFAVNVRAVFVATQAAVKHMKGGGRVVNIGSCNAERMPFAGGAAYAMSKSALVAGACPRASAATGPHSSMSHIVISPDSARVIASRRDGSRADSVVNRRCARPAALTHRARERPAAATPALPRSPP